MKILLGYEVGTGKPVEVPLGHLAVTGQTQLSGKTTTLEALIARSGLRAVAFVTKRGEQGFSQARVIAPYFRERADWRFVKSLLESQARTRMNFEAAWIVRACKAARSLADVQEAVQETMKSSRRSLDQNICEVLNAYLELVIPQLDRLPYTKTLKLEPGINAMNLLDYSSELQALVIRSVLEGVYQHEQNTIVIIPEAWEFIPQKRGSPVKLAAEELIRKGAGLKNFIWLDSQDIAGVDKDILRSVSVWILGVQREANEVRRALAHIGLESPKPKPADVMNLGKGEFYVSFERELRRVYVQPRWLSSGDAQKIARGELPKTFDGLRQAAQPKRQTLADQEDEAVWKEKYEQAADRVRSLEYKVSQLESRLSEAKSDAEARVERLTEPPACGPVGPKITTGTETPALGSSSSLPDKFSSIFQGDTLKALEEIYGYIVDRLQKDPAPGILEVIFQRPELYIKTKPAVLQIDGSTVQGKIAQLIAEGFFDSCPNGNTVFRELLRRGCRVNVATSYRALQELARLGFLTNEGKGKGFRAVAGAKITVLEDANA